VEALPPDIRYVLDRLGQAGGHAWMVGGCVRDVVSGKTPREVDVTTTLLPEQVLHVRFTAFPSNALWVLAMDCGKVHCSEVHLVHRSDARCNISICPNPPFRMASWCCVTKFSLSTLVLVVL
jgi:Poly A polymerase head domain